MFSVKSDSFTPKAAALSCMRRPVDCRGALRRVTRMAEASQGGFKRALKDTKRLVCSTRSAWTGGEGLNYKRHLNKPSESLRVFSVWTLTRHLGERRSLAQTCRAFRKPARGRCSFRKPFHRVQMLRFPFPRDSGAPETGIRCTLRVGREPLKALLSQGSKLAA